MMDGLVMDTLRSDEMARTQKLVDVDLYGALGTGSTKSEAKAQAEAKITKAFAGDGQYNPHMFRFPRGEVVTVYRTLEGWTYGTLWPDETGTVSYGSGLYESKRDATMHALRNIAQHYWDDEASGYGLNLLLALDDEGQREQTSYRRFQMAYRLLKAQGKTDTQCHYEACQAMSA
jgi:hypothetical protein